MAVAGQAAAGGRHSTAKITGMAPPVVFRHHLRDLRKRRGAFACETAAADEIARLLALLPDGTIERLVFELSEIETLPYKTIAARIGISERHLYRVRCSMFERLAAGEQRAQVRPVVPVELQRLELARTQLKYGHASACLETLDHVLAASLPPVHTLRALTVRAMGLSDLEQYSQARNVLSDACRIEGHLQGRDREIGSRMVTMASAYIPYRDGASDEAILLSESALREAGVLSNDDYATRDLVRDLIFAGIQHQEAGSPKRALDFLHRAHAAVKQLPVQPAAELAQIHIHSAFARAALADQSAQAREDALEALRLAQWHGLHYEEVWANIAVAVLSEMAGKPAEGLPYVHHALSIAQTALDGDPFIRTLFMTARLEGAAGNSASALRRLQTAEPLAQNHGLLRGILEVAQARARRQQGNSETTISASTKAIDALEGRALTHYLGIPYLARAAARAQLGFDARGDVERAMYYLDRGGSLVDQADALELSYRFTRNRRDLQLSRELRHVAAKIA